MATLPVTSCTCPPSTQIDVDVLRLHELADALFAALATEAAALEAAERDVGRHRREAVDPDPSRVERGSDAVGALQVGGPDVAGEAVVGVVGDRDGLGLVVEPD